MLSCADVCIGSGKVCILGWKQQWEDSCRKTFPILPLVPHYCLGTIIASSSHRNGNQTALEPCEVNEQMKLDASLGCSLPRYLPPLPQHSEPVDCNIEPAYSQLCSSYESADGEVANQECF